MQRDRVIQNREDFGIVICGNRDIIRRYAMAGSWQQN